MLKTLTEFFNTINNDDRTELDGDHVRTATAVLLFHAIAIDGVADDTERARIHALLRDHFDLGDAEVAKLLHDAEEREKNAVDLYRFTSVLRDRLSLDEKREVISMMWRLAYADGELAALEDNLIWRTAELLAVPARDRMELKKLVLNEMGQGS
ncbi:MAG: TerB family tellurite resistance protein [Hyphomicrobiales bacterium]|nr:TerB family tellurite resistance protein [Hyphomicrobiales bacterium]